MTPDDHRVAALQAAAAKGLEVPKFSPRKPMTALQAKVWKAEMIRVQEGWKR